MKVYVIKYIASLKMWLCLVDSTFSVHAQMTSEQLNEIPDYLDALKISASMNVDDMQRAAKEIPNSNASKYVRG